MGGRVARGRHEERKQRDIQIIQIAKLSVTDM